MKLPKEFRELLEPLVAAGYTLEPTRNQHMTVRAPDGRRITTVSGTSSDRRALLNTRADLRRALRDSSAEDYRWPLQSDRT